MPDLKEKNRIILKNSKMHELWDLGAPTILEQALQTIVAFELYMMFYFTTIFVCFFCHLSISNYIIEAYLCQLSQSYKH